jgi:hypothetical protein
VKRRGCSHWRATRDHTKMIWLVVTVVNSPKLLQCPSHRQPAYSQMVERLQQRRYCAERFVAREFTRISLQPPPLVNRNHEQSGQVSGQFRCRRSEDSS